LALRTSEDKNHQKIFMQKEAQINPQSKKMQRFRENNLVEIKSLEGLKRK